MPKDKDRTLNPAMAQRKLDKQKSLKKSKAEALSRRNEKLARRNPDRIQRQIGELKSMEEAGQSLRPREKQILEALERDLRAVQKAREELGDKAPRFEGGGARRGGDGGGDNVLGKRRRDEHNRGRFHGDKDESSDETDEEVRRIPMPQDTPPPIPREHQRKTRAGDEPRGPHALPSKPPAVEAKAVYESAPDIRNLRQEAISKFVPAAVRVKQESIKGQGKLLEPEEMDRLEKAGYTAGPSTEKAPDTGQIAGDVDAEEQRLLEEEKRFNQELKRAHVEDVEDEEA